MQFRSARHTDNIEGLKTFYTEIIGLDILGDFKDHDGYSGIFLGLMTFAKNEGIAILALLFSLSDVHN